MGIGATALAQEVLMDQINTTSYDEARGNAIGGDNLGNGDCYALQICDDFRTTNTGFILTEVAVANLFGVGFHSVSDARVSIYADLGGKPAEQAVFSERVSAMHPGPSAVRARFTNEPFDDFQYQFAGVLTTITGLWIPLEPETGYFICVQVDAGPDNWAYSCLEQHTTHGSDSFYRDGPPEEGCQGVWGHTTWQAMGDRYVPADVNYRVVAISRPPPRPDFDGDGAVTAGDVAAYLSAWSAGEGDVDGDGDSDAGDVLRFLGEWAGERAKAPNGQRAKSGGRPEA
ncbi:MAG: hypothetical protein IPJ41_01015 [Phycisphaerales bacterium]|nr:hypothetical protein [Phycisphaerales bacterium]